MGGDSIDYLFLLVTGIIAYHGITYRDQNGESTVGHLLFGCIALVYFVWVLLFHVLRVA